MNVGLDIWVVGEECDFQCEQCAIIWLVARALELDLPCQFVNDGESKLLRIAAADDTGLGLETNL